MKKNIYKKLFVFLNVIVSLTLLISLGYAQISNVDLSIDGDVSLLQQNGIVISDIHYSSCNDMTTDSVTIDTYYQSMFTSHVELGNTSSSFITLEVTIKNLTSDPYIFDGLVYDSNFYSNSNIVPSLSGITENTTILNPDGETGDEVTFYLTFSYLDPNNITNQTLNSTINFHFTPTVKINYSGLTNSSGNTEEYIRRASFTNSNPTTYTPSVNLGSFSGNFTITDSSSNTLTLGTDYTYSNGIVTFLNSLTEDEYTITASQSGSGLAAHILSLINGLTPDSEGIYTATPASGCTNTLVYDGTSDNNLRYVGTDPCNYIKFNCDDSGNNCELWRMIGVMYDVGGTNVKIVKGSLDYANSKMHNSGNTNIWINTDLYSELNSTYYSGLNAKYGKNQIASVNWNVGGIDNTWTPSNFYSKEHSEQLTSPANIGLFSPADYGYATSGGGTARTSCVAAQLNNGGNAFYSSNCRNNNWFYTTSYYQFTLIRRPSSNNNFYYITNSGLSAYSRVNTASSYNNYRPCVYLKSTAAITGGDGSSGSPYELVGVSS